MENLLGTVEAGLHGASVRLDPKVVMCLGGLYIVHQVGSRLLLGHL